MNKSRKGERGQSLVELAISLIVILMLLLGAVEFSLALFQYVTIRDAAQEGALYGSITPTDEAGMKARAIDAASDVVQLTAGDIGVSWSNPSKKCEGLTVTGGVPVPNSITVTITYNHVIALPLVGPMIGDNDITLTASVTDTILTPYCN
ncbi:MAG: TadE/TadG family type IV pilus assembly protein [Anaerolineales bacterium]|nr:TadE/TadG family type IV pilus assembly protein [Anaerolineales bacterium]